MEKYRYTEHEIGYQVGRALRPWRPQYPIIVSWVKKGAKILDVGCGDGVLGERLIKEKNCTVYGIDLDEVGVAEAKRRGVKAKVWDIDSGLPFGDKSFDVVIANEVLQYTSNPNFVVAELLRVGQTTIISFPNFGFWLYRILHLSGRFPKIALYGENWWDTNQTKFFSFADFLSLPSMKTVTIEKAAFINWRNRKVSFLARFFPNLFGRSCILKISDK